MSNKSEKKVTIGEKLRELRLAHGYKQVDVAGAVDIRQPTYSQYEAGIRTPSSLILYRLASFYGISTDDLLKLCIDLDDDVYFEALPHTDAGIDEADFLIFSKQERYKDLNSKELELLYHFSKMDKNDRQEIIDFADFKRQHKASNLAQKLPSSSSSHFKKSL